MTGLGVRPLDSSAHWLKPKRNCFQCNSLSWEEPSSTDANVQAKVSPASRLTAGFLLPTAEVILARPADVPLNIL